MRTLQVSDETFDELLDLVSKGIFGAQLAIRFCTRHYGPDSEETLQEEHHLQVLQAIHTELTSVSAADTSKAQ